MQLRAGRVSCSAACTAQLLAVDYPEFALHAFVTLRCDVEFRILYGEKTKRAERCEREFSSSNCVDCAEKLLYLLYALRE